MIDCPAHPIGGPDRPFQSGVDAVRVHESCFNAFQRLREVSARDRTRDAVGGITKFVYCGGARRVDRLRDGRRKTSGRRDDSKREVAYVIEIGNGCLCVWLRVTGLLCPRPSQIEGVRVHVLHKSEGATRVVPFELQHCVSPLINQVLPKIEKSVCYECDLSFCSVSHRLINIPQSEGYRPQGLSSAARPASSGITPASTAAL